MPEVSVIMNCRNGEAFVADAIASVLSQTFGDFEIVFWDNQSSDRSADIAQGVGGPLRYFRSPTPMTLGEARNAAVSQARGRYLAVLDVDDRWFPDKLKSQVSLMNADPQVGLVYSDSERVDQSGTRISLWSQERRLRRGAVLDDLLTSCFISMSTILIRRSLLDAVGMFNPSYTQVEEWDLYLRVAEHSAIDYVDAVLARETIHTTNYSRDYDHVADETCAMLAAWAGRSPRHASLCHQQIAAARFRQAGVRAYRAMRSGQARAVLQHAVTCTGLVLSHPIALSRSLAPYLSASNRRMFVARFS